MKTYDKEGWWQECVKAKPDLPRGEFDRRWARFWFWARLFGDLERA